ncbi:MAG: hypothetical protein QOJ07_3656 [Thermoleophilaceae bacterium]|jgi:uncharacterized protein (TIGR00730 family)|nr:hypothetical protein [Thermoleophilaceae bacterium]
MSSGGRPRDPAAHRHVPPAHPEPPATLDEELLGADIAAVISTETDASRVDRMAAELHNGFAAMEAVGRGVSILGSARTTPDDPDYRLARETARRLGEAGFDVITGGGPGTMAAANQGARDAGALSVGLRIDLPFEQGLNPWVDLGIDFHYFFTRKIMFVRYASAFVVMPGGYGTLDELFEALTLIQTHKVRHFPVVLMGHDYWGGLLDWMRATLLEDGKIGPGDLDLMHVTDDPAEVVEVVATAADLQGWDGAGGSQADPG